jgi:hypothetical protein
VKGGKLGRILYAVKEKNKLFFLDYKTNINQNKIHNIFIAVLLIFSLALKRRCVNVSKNALPCCLFGVA